LLLLFGVVFRDTGANAELEGFHTEPLKMIFLGRTARDKTSLPRLLLSLGVLSSLGVVVVDPADIVGGGEMSRRAFRLLRRKRICPTFGGSIYIGGDPVDLAIVVGAASVKETAISATIVIDLALTDIKRARFIFFLYSKLKIG